MGVNSVSDQTAPKSRGGKRYYVWPSRDRQETERYWSVTTIIDGAFPKPALLGWAVKQTAIYAIENLDLLRLHLKKDLNEHGQLPPPDPETGKPSGEGGQEAYKLLWNGRFAKSQRAADLGSRVHEAIETYVLDKPAPAWPKDIAPYLEQALAFLRHFEVMVEMTEAAVYNRMQKYAGRLDMIATIADKRWLVDFKTGSGVYPEAALQMAAYKNAEFIGKPDKTEEPMPEIECAAVVHLQPTHYSFIPVDIGETVYNHFLYGREVFRWTEFDSKQVVSDPVPNLERLAERVSNDQQVVAS
jgi:hypothetical protein